MANRSIKLHLLLAYVLGLRQWFNDMFIFPSNLYTICCQEIHQILSYLLYPSNPPHFVKSLILGVHSRSFHIHKPVPTLQEFSSPIHSPLFTVLNFLVLSQPQDFQFQKYQRLQPGYEIHGLTLINDMLSGAKKHMTKCFMCVVLFPHCNYSKRKELFPSF